MLFNKNKRPTGHWRTPDGHTEMVDSTGLVLNEKGLRCSNCQTSIDYGTVGGFTYGRYCAYCGAKMAEPLEKGL